MTDREEYGHRPPTGYGRKPWAARHKVLAGFLACCGLVFVIGIAAAAASSSSSSTPQPRASSLTPKVTVAEARSTARKTPAPTATTAVPSTPAQTTPAPAQTTPAAQPVTTSTPARTTAAPAPSPSSQAPAKCYPLSDEGTCYEPGEYCRDSDHGVSGVAGNGEAIKCEDNDGWRWEPV